ncbi:hypothetical protein Cyrtocomes_00753 [Candidatus Cyrtobacter comes]|uniref:DUF6468 domain-containing protein n=1 Tax=Candidatus Cyrtobacter comes TaxID=675776 RepID=A0ABU5L8C8_9RICK|nr:DUF6468 domain-containing protein [Candidatus Cyrtobacter comes]MDZ5762374.1 hypothetical protein [Candidatus Cyrtobacter comes]
MNYLFDISIFVLLAMTIVFCWRLNGKLLELKRSRNDISKLVRVFDESIIRTSQSISELKEASAKASEELRKSCYKTHELINEISFATDTSSRILRDLEEAISKAGSLKREVNFSNEEKRRKHASNNSKKHAQKKPMVI